MTNLDVHFSSAKSDWETPDDLFQKYNDAWRFKLDVCATAKNTKCKRYYNSKMDGLKLPWDAVWWCNPPYGDPETPCKNPRLRVGLRRNGKLVCKKKCVKRGFHIFEYIPGIADWIAKGAEARYGVMLLPARTDTRWFHTYIWDVGKNKPRPGVTVEFLPGRVKFKGAKHSAPFPSMIVSFA